MRHGTHTGYAHHGCRCERCREAERQANLTPCLGFCGGMARKGSHTGLCQTCYAKSRRDIASRPLLDGPPRLSSVELGRRAEAALKLLRAGESDCEGLLAAVVWPKS